MNIEFADEMDDCLVVEHKVVVRRFIHRQQIAKMTKQTRATNKRHRFYNYWVERWEMVKQSSSLADLFHPIQPIVLDSSHARSKLRVKLRSRSEICCTGCDEHPDNYAEEYFHDLLQAHIASGIPIMFWPGRARKLDLKMIREKKLCVQVEFLLSHLQRMQLDYLTEYEYDFHHHNLFIIYDNPDRMLPWASDLERSEILEHNANE